MFQAKWQNRIGAELSQTQQKCWTSAPVTADVYVKALIVCVAAGRGESTCWGGAEERRGGSAVCVWWGEKRGHPQETPAAPDTIQGHFMHS